MKECDKYKHLFFVGFAQKAGIVEWDGRSPSAEYVSTIFEVPVNDPTISLAVGRQGERGRFYGGTFHSSFCSAPNNASFYMYSKEKGLQLLFTGTQTTTGVAFDDNARKVYHIDTCFGLITKFQGDEEGNICNVIEIYSC